MASPFHKGEKMIQSMLGVREQMEMFGGCRFRDYMPNQHRDFYGKLPYMFAAHADEDGWPWASILCGKPGFVKSVDPRILTINGGLLKGDPLRKVFSKPGERIGFLGIELPTRRRNRVSMEVVEAKDNKTTLAVKQAFGNCPQYIQSRAHHSVTLPPDHLQTVEEVVNLSEREKNLIRLADTFFVASYLNDPTQGPNATQGADISHRGGRPGFVSVSGNTLTIPDYSGNGQFNTFGNIILNKKAGLLFIDFEKGDILTLTGTAEILFDETQHFPGAERIWKFTLHQGWYCKSVLPLRFSFQDMSREAEETGTWREALEIKRQNEQAWIPHKVTKMVSESETVKSVYLSIPEHLKGSLLDFSAGKFLTLRAKIPGHGTVTRTYTISSSFADSHFRISVKKEENGLFSNWIHKKLEPHTVIDCKKPAGAFFLKRNVNRENREVLLFAGGIGITPMISIIRQQVACILYEMKSKASHGKITLLYSSRDETFLKELRELEKQSNGIIRIVLFNTSSGNRITSKSIKKYISGDVNKIEGYICGPTGFMQAMYLELRKLDIPDERIFDEGFGPASIKRDSDPVPVPVASAALVQFSTSDTEHQWNSNGTGMTLLELAESRGLSPNSGCRSGKCGSCKYRLESGVVSYRTKPLIDLEDSDVLLCCAAPAAVKGESLPKVIIGGL